MKLFAIVFLTLIVFPLTAQAARRGTASGQVVHSRRAPVVLHRMVPPFKGIHVYQGVR